MRWNIVSEDIPESSEDLIAVLLANRGITDRESFLHPTSPLDLTPTLVGMDPDAIDRAILRLKQAHTERESIVIYGDYDADGVCATTVLWETMYTLGFSVTPFIPHREHHGYGLSSRGVDEIFAKNKPAILISVDNGIVAHDQWRRLRDAGVYTILTDHHEPDEHLPEADCIIHTTQLCGASVAWMFAKEITQRMSPAARKKIADMLDLCAIATIADQVPLLGANRSFATDGLKALNQTTRLGLVLLIESTQLKLGEIDTYGVNFGIAPRINAMGRLESALDALRALCTRDRSRAAALITKIQDTNHTRQDLTQVLIDKAMRRQSEWRDEHIIVVEDEEFHEGVIGLIAGRLTEVFHKPAIVLAVGDRTAKGSARSLAGIHITSLLREFRGEYLLEVGGHPLAAGLKIETEKIAAFRRALYARARDLISVESLTPVIDLDCQLPQSLMTLQIAKEICVLAPFGAGNREPMFAFPPMRLLDAKLVGKDGKHLKLVFDDLEAMAFGKGKLLETLTIGQTITLAGHLSINEWRGSTRLQILVKDFKNALLDE